MDERILKLDNFSGKPSVYLGTDTTMNFDWKENGFADLPVLRSATGKETLYRAWGGNPTRKWGNKNLPGVCFSLDKATSRWHAEMLYAVMEYQNPVRYLTEFTVPALTPIWVGKVHPGDPRALLGNVSGTQVLVERAYLNLVTEGATTALSNDLATRYLHTNRMPRVSS